MLWDNISNPPTYILIIYRHHCLSFQFSCNDLIVSEYTPQKDNIPLENALQFAKDTMFLEKNGNRIRAKNVFVLLSDQNDVSPEIKEAADQLRLADVTVS